MATETCFKNKIHKSDLLSLLVLSAVFCLFFVTDSFSQVTIQPYERTIEPSSKKQTAKTARSKALLPDPLQLPFFDDFSNPNGFYPDTMKWVDGYSVWVNDGMAINQPTIKVATFDGLDSTGLAYNPTEILVTGYTDELVSQPIDLGLASVPVADRPGVFFSFFYQWQGNGEAPDINDYLELEFKDTADVWISVLVIFPEEEILRTEFYKAILPVGEAFFHEDFQFRIRSFGRQSGPFDTWNIDYVYLNRNRDAADIYFPEAAAGSPLTSMFGQYNAIPYSHFLATKDIVPMTFEVQNLKDRPVVVNYGVVGTFVNYKDSVATTYTAELVNESDGLGIKKNPDGSTEGLMQPGERVNGVYDTRLPDPNDALQFDPEADSVDVEMQLIIFSGDSTDAFKGDLAPIDLRLNDTISRVHYLHDYYAYDDGVAEFSAGLIEPGNLIAYQFEILSPDPDTLVAFKIHFAPWAVENNQTMTFYIYDDDNGKPGKAIQTIFSQRIERKNANEFQTITWRPALLVDSTFYIGWKQPIVGKALVGLDYDRDTADRIFVNTTNSWYVNNVIHGSFMIRPVFGSGEVEGPVGVEDEFKLSIYPNPTSGQFYIEGQFDDLKIFSVTGNEVSFQSEKVGDKTLVDIQKSSGLFILKVLRGQRVYTEKVVLRR